MNYLYNTIFETFEYDINKKLKDLKSYKEVNSFIEKCILELEMIDTTYLLNDKITTKHNYTYYLININNIDNTNKKIMLKYNFDESNINDIITYCKKVNFIEPHIHSNITFSELLEYYYVAHLYFHKYVFIKCLKNYIYMLSHKKRFYIL
jgi:hypothetical protein